MNDAPNLIVHCVGNFLASERMNDSWGGGGRQCVREQWIEVSWYNRLVSALK